VAKETHLKTRNTPLFVLFVLWCLALYLSCQLGPLGFSSHFRDIVAELRAKDGIFVVFSPLLAIVLGGFLSSGNKARLIFWRSRHVLPGHRAFSQLAPTDPRIDMRELRRLVQPWPASPKEQNSCWYSLYKRHAERPTVVHAHAAFLLARDMATVAFLFLPFGTLGLAFAQPTMRWPLIYAAFMLVQYFVLMIVARNHAQRFVCNVLAEHLTAGRP
jgi:hypothetical protein